MGVGVSAGSLFVALSLMWLHQLPILIPLGIGLILVDTGGIHWFFGVMVYQLMYSIYQLVRGQKGS
jgi:hypothetical protein